MKKWMIKEMNAWTIFYYLGLLLLLFFLFIFFGKINYNLFPQSLIQWDAAWYSSIKEFGYILKENEQSNVGFFPGFPYLWRLIGGSAFGISILNFSIFLFTFFLLAKSFKANNLTTLFLLSIPSIFFFYVPYSEALFYAFAVLSILAWEREKWIELFFCFLLLSLVRPSVFFLFPAVFSLLVFKYKSRKETIRIFLLLFSLGIGTLIGFSIIGQSTGDFLAYSNAQTIHWNHEFSLPEFPLTTWRGYRILWLDGWALYALLSTLYFGILGALTSIKKKRKQQLDDLVIISVVYLIMILIYVLFFHLEEEGSTSILSLNRYVFCNPFFHYLVFYSVKNELFALKKWRFLLISFATILLFGFPFTTIVGLNFEISLLFFIGLVFFFLLQTFFLWQEKYSFLFLLLFLFNIFLQVYTFQGFLKGNWIG